MPLDVIWSRRARTRLQEIRASVALDKPEAAERLATRIVVLIESLRMYPHLGRPGIEPGTRELVIGGTPYVVGYRVGSRRVIIQTSWHGAQRGGLGAV